MPRSRSTLSTDEIKSIARRQMAENGTAGISLRGIARELDVTAPAIYNYFPRLDDLITALIVDAFNGLADHIEERAATAQPLGFAAQFKAGALGYREWAIAHPADFQLIYGNPIPGYVAPEELTIPLARRPFETLFTAVGGALQEGSVHLPEFHQPMPPTVRAYLEGMPSGYFPSEAERVPAELVFYMLLGWARMHGFVMLEMFEHINNPIGDPAAAYAFEIDEFLRAMGMDPPADV